MNTRTLFNSSPRFERCRSFQISNDSITSDEMTRTPETLKKYPKNTLGSFPMSVKFRFATLQPSLTPLKPSIRAQASNYGGRRTVEAAVRTRKKTTAACVFFLCGLGLFLCFFVGFHSWAIINKHPFCLGSVFSFFNAESPEL